MKDMIRISPGDMVAVALRDMKKGARLALDYILSHPELQKEDPDFDAWCDRLIERLEQVKAQFRDEMASGN